MTRDLYRIFRVNAQQRLDELGMTRRELAKQLGVTPSYVSQVLNGLSSPGLETIDKFADALRIAPAALLTEEIFSRAS